MVIKVNDLEIQKGAFKLGKINYTFEDGYVYGILGNSGAGKTLFLQSILGSLELPKEVVEYDKKNFYDNELEIKMEYSYVADRPLFSNRLAVESLIAKLEKLDPRFNKEKCLKILAKYKIYKDLKVHELSTSQEKILLFAIGVSTISKVLVLDNPFSGVGIVERKELLAHLRDYIDEDRIIIIVTEDAEVIRNFVDYILIFENGKLTHSEDVVELQARYKNISVEEILLDILKGDVKNE